jgi:hypothetical protein
MFELRGDVVPSTPMHTPPVQRMFNTPQFALRGLQVLCCAVLCCAVLFCAVLCCSVLFCAVLFCSVLCWDV